MHKNLDQPFDVTITINFSGRTKSDGEVTLTPQMLIDKMTAPLEEAIGKRLIRDYQIKVKVNNLEEAEAIIAKAEKEN